MAAKKIFKKQILNKIQESQRYKLEVNSFKKIIFQYLKI